MSHDVRQMAADIAMCSLELVQAVSHSPNCVVILNLLHGAFPRTGVLTACGWACEALARESADEASSRESAGGRESKLHCRGNAYASIGIQSK
eukprot:4911431-Amphidinium_carterae.1